MNSCNAKPILFNASMVRSILDYEKTQTRRCIPKRLLNHMETDPLDHSYAVIEDDYGKWPHVKTLAPYQPGQILWVREPARVVDYRYNDESVCFPTIKYTADGSVSEIEMTAWRIEQWECLRGDAPKWVLNRQGIPNGVFREACRLWLRITGVCFQWLQDITEKDAKAEGILDTYACNFGHTFKLYDTKDCFVFSPVASFSTLWDTCAKPGSRWEDNPFVWAYTFERCDKPEEWE